MIHESVSSSDEWKPSYSWVLQLFFISFLLFVERFCNYMILRDNTILERFLFKLIVKVFLVSSVKMCSTVFQKNIFSAKTLVLKLL